MEKTHHFLLGCLVGMAAPLVPLHAEEIKSPSTLLTYNNRPLGSEQKPLLMRTFMPNIELGDAVLAHHEKGFKAAKYSPEKGKDIPGEDLPIEGLPAAIGVNYGANLSYCWDTVECRLVYAWSGGFLDMTTYWGDPERGNRQSFGYVPKLVGTLYYKAQGAHPLTVNGKSISANQAPKYKGYVKKGTGYHFSYRAGAYDITASIETSSMDPYTLIQRFRLTTLAKIKTKLDFTPSAGVTVRRISNQEILVTTKGTKLAEYRGHEVKDLLDGGINAENGEKVFKAMACMTCHSIDGAKSHGPSLLGLHGSKRKIKGQKDTVLADDAYILESIQTPNAKVVEGFPENYMPPYKLKDEEYQALSLFIKSLKKD